MSTTRAKGKRTWQGVGRGKQPRRYATKNRVELKIGIKTSVETNPLTERARAMGNGLYGENQGNETRAAGRHAEEGVKAEALSLDQSRNAGYGRELEHMRALFNLGGMESIAKYVRELVTQWSGEFILPEREADETDKRYAKRCETAQSKHYHLVLRKVQGMISQATRGESRMLTSEGGSFKRGEKLAAPGDRPIVHHNKEDWTLPVGLFHAPSEG